jgi:hypothetical protein
VLAVDTTEARLRSSKDNGDGRSRTDIFLVASEALVQLSYIPLSYSLLSSPMLGVRANGGWPAGLEPAPAGITTPGASVYTTATRKRSCVNGDDRTRTGALSPDK